MCLFRFDGLDLFLFYIIDCMLGGDFFSSNGNFDAMFFKFVLLVLLNLGALCLFLLFSTVFSSGSASLQADCHEWWSD